MRVRFGYRWVDRRPDSALAHYSLAEVLSEHLSSDPDRLLYEFRTALILRPDFNDAARELAWALSRLERHQEALTYCTDLSQSERFSPSVRQACAWISGKALVSLGRCKDALEPLGRAAAVAAEAEDTRKLRARALALRHTIRDNDCRAARGHIAVIAVYPNQLAAKIGVKEGDVLVRLGTYRPLTVPEWRDAFTTRPDEEISLHVVGANGMRTVILPGQPRMLGVLLESL